MLGRQAKCKKTEGGREDGAAAFHCGFLHYIQQLDTVSAETKSSI